ncbi:amidohydrolase [Evansella sp. AB-rgal1]|uniref:amidohydrolase n=1 Tax=Evansella sp. AB-rgal1 TaxID=3242696 RepID=UPI00359E8ED1
MYILLHSVTIVTLNKENEIFQGYVVWKDGKFTDIVKGDPTSNELAKVPEIINGNGKWLMPGLINSHGHLGSSFLRGAGDDLPLMTWLETIMWPNERTFTEETVIQAASLAMIEMIKTGTTTFLDMYHLAMDKIAELVLQSELRAVLCRGMIGLAPEKEQEEKLEESVSLFHNYHGANNNKLTIALAPHAPYTCPPEFLQKVVKTAGRNNMWIHTHLSETRGEVERHVSQYGMRPVEHLQNLGLFQQHCLIAHGVHINEKEVQILAEERVSVSHNPMSNLKLGSGIAPVPMMEKTGVNVALGTDSTASNNNLDLFEEMRFASLIHKGVHEDPTVTTSESILKMATTNGAKALQLDHVGCIEKGYFADFILIDPNVPHLHPWNEERIISHLVYSVKGSDVTDSFVQGKQLMKNREILTLDEEKILSDAINFLKTSQKG